ncbi:cytochrome P450 monooxygenase [Rhizoctonia solani AG-1 IA]|uniref:Cytochrome P450 monooxygenase n=1 Tax=Thanatephorus cucumeris (strain AG1-IA) TaxID=983506 RepID=L8X010_THACA|nr:cytochrome P450 monooxygenase [Rhizoctonia solani AG-1 IA]
MFRLVRSGHHSEAVKELHEKYGTFVRLGPNHISIADPDAFESVYGHGNGLLKSEFYDAFQGGPETDTFNARDKAENESDLLQFLAHKTFSVLSLVYAATFKSYARNGICDAMRQVAGSLESIGLPKMRKRSSMFVLFSYLAFDITGDLSLGSPFGLVQAQKDSSLSVESVDVSGETKQGTVEIPIARTIAGGLAQCTTIGLFPSWAHNIHIFLPWNALALFDRLRFFKLATTLVDARLKRGSGKDMEDGSGKRNIDLIDKLIEIQDENGNPLPKDEMIAEAVLLLVAGSDTIQQELQAELDKHIIYDDSHRYEVKEGVAVPGYDVVAWYDDIKGLPFLNACVKETLRIHSTIGIGLPRVVPPGKEIRIAGQTFKPGSVISVPSYTTNRASVWGSNATEFQPKRWLDDKSGSLSKYFVPFSVGPRACIGRNLGYMELMLIAATLVRRYDIEALPITKMVTHEGFTREAVHCEVAIKRRKA